MAEKRPNNYFDDIPTSHRQIKVFMIRSHFIILEKI